MHNTNFLSIFAEITVIIILKPLSLSTTTAHQSIYISQLAYVHWTGLDHLHC